MAGTLVSERVCSSSSSIGGGSERSGVYFDYNLLTRLYTKKGAEFGVIVISRLKI